jgi:transcriptional regulator with XRE-family HTH domain
MRARPFVLLRRVGFESLPEYVFRSGYGRPWISQLENAKVNPKLELIVTFADTLKADALAVLCPRRAKALEAQSRRTSQIQEENILNVLSALRFAVRGPPTRGARRAQGTVRGQSACGARSVLFVLFSARLRSP